MKITMPPGAPTWLTSVVGQIERGFAEVFPTSPVRLPHFPSSNYPDAAHYVGSLIWVTDLSKVAYSNGTTWVTLP